MAKGKKGFMLYADLLPTLEKMPDDKAGILFKHILKYVNDLNPETTDLIVDIAFEPIKQQLKRDLLHWESVKEKRSDAGKASAIKRQQVLTNVESVEQKPTKSTVIEKVNVIDKVINIPEWADFFSYAKTLPIYKPTLDYSIRAKYNAWVENGWKDGYGKKISKWKSKIQNTLPFLEEVNHQQSRNNPPKGY